MNACVINLGRGAWYPRGQARLRDSLVHHGQGVITYLWSDESQIGAPYHQDVPYAFKPAAFNYAQSQGHDVVLWCDCSVWAIRNIQPVLNHIKEHGHVFFAGGWDCGQWSTDTALENLGVTRDEATAMPMFMACCMGLDLSTEKGQKFLEKWTRLSLDGKTFPGPWSNDDKQASKDPRCLGHRHDQTAGSIIAAQLNMSLTIGHETYFAYYYDKMEDIKETVCLLAQGM